MEESVRNANQKIYSNEDALIEKRNENALLKNINIELERGIKELKIQMDVQAFELKSNIRTIASLTKEKIELEAVTSSYFDTISILKLNNQQLSINCEDLNRKVEELNKDLDRELQRAVVARRGSLVNSNKSEIKNNSSNDNNSSTDKADNNENVIMNEKSEEFNVDSSFG
jgi:hypothetical protein